jgi:hypothetical protein
MSDPTPSERYADEATRLDELLVEQLAEVRRQQDAGLIGPSEAAYARVGLMETHLSLIKALRVKHFPLSS